MPNVKAGECRKGGHGGRKWTTYIWGDCRRKGGGGESTEQMNVL